MSATKRSRSGQPTAASKRQKVAAPSTTETKTNGLAFLVDENARAGKLLKAELTNGVSASRSPKTAQARPKVAADVEESEDEDDEVEETTSAATTNGTTSKSSRNQPAKARKPSTAEVIDISSGDDSSDLEEEDDDVEMLDSLPPTTTNKSLKPLTNGVVAKLRNETSADSDDANNEEQPAFGELLARHTGQINVEESLGNSDGRQLAHVDNERNFDGLSSATLGTVLTQALKTNDKDQLETCFQVTDTERIRATIQRLQSQHVATLLQRISERIYSRPGRTGSLFVWIQWSLVVHGGYLATHTEVMKKLKSLSRVIKERARGLQPLLHLKGKIDMLSGQLELRRSLQQRNAFAYGGDLDNEEGVVYIEGQDDDDEDWDSEDEAEPTGRSRSRKALPAPDADSDSEDGVNGIVNGVEGESDDDDEEDDEDEDSEGMLDIEAEETDDDDGSDVSGEGESLEEDDDEEDEDDDDESEAEVVAKSSKLSGRRR